MYIVQFVLDVSRRMTSYCILCPVFCTNVNTVAEVTDIILIPADTITIITNTLSVVTDTHFFAQFYKIITIDNDIKHWVTFK